MPYSLISICGPSAVGKLTLIRSIFDHQQTRCELGISPDDDPFLAVGKDFKHSVHALTPDVSCKTILHKWQAGKGGLLQELDVIRDRLDVSNHRILMLWLDWDLWWHGYRSKYPTFSYSIDTCFDWIYETMLTGIMHNPYGIDVEHFTWRYPRRAGPPTYTRIAKAPQRPKRNASA